MCRACTLSIKERAPRQQPSLSAPKGGGAAIEGGWGGLVEALGLVVQLCDDGGERLWVCAILEELQGEGEGLAIEGRIEEARHLLEDYGRRAAVLQSGEAAAGTYGRGGLRRP